MIYLVNINHFGVAFSNHYSDNEAMKPLDLAIQHAEGVSKLASALGVGQSVVSNWKARDSLIDAVYCTAIDRMPGSPVRRWHLRPDDWHQIWPELIGAEGAPVIPEPAPQA